jgi:hypothetical protein
MMTDFKRCEQICVKNGFLRKTTDHRYCYTLYAISAILSGTGWSNAEIAAAAKVSRQRVEYYRRRHKSRLVTNDNYARSFRYSQREYSDIRTGCYVSGQPMHDNPVIVTADHSDYTVGVFRNGKWLLDNVRIQPLYYCEIPKP